MHRCRHRHRHYRCPCHVRTTPTPLAAHVYRTGLGAPRARLSWPARGQFHASSRQSRFYCHVPQLRLFVLLPGLWINLGTATLWIARKLFGAMFDAERERKVSEELFNTFDGTRGEKDGGCRGKRRGAPALLPVAAVPLEKQTPVWDQTGCCGSWLHRPRARVPPNAPSHGLCLSRCCTHGVVL